MVAANDGNISVRDHDGTILCTPSGVSKGFLDPDSLARVTVDGEVLSETGPSSEVRMHLRVYQEDPQVGAVVHAHPMYATIFAIEGRELTKQLLPETVVTMPHVPLATYGTPSTEEVPDSVAPFVQDYTACLLEQHGALTWGKDLMTSYLAMERLEHLCKTQFLLDLVGVDRELSTDQIEALHRIFG